MKGKDLETRGPGGAPAWQAALEVLERSLRDASWAITLLRRALEGEAPAPARGRRAQPAPARRAADGAPAPAGPNSQPAAEAAPGGSTFERLWDRIEHERLTKEAAGTPADGAGIRRLDLLPQHYMVTVEDRESKVDLVPLHRALTSLSGVQEISLVSYANGVPVISLRMEGELNLDRLAAAVSTAMDRECETIPHDNGKIFLRLKGREGQAG